MLKAKINKNTFRVKGFLKFIAMSTKIINDSRETAAYPCDKICSIILQK
jgi:hypothetical protein